MIVVVATAPESDARPAIAPRKRCEEELLVQIDDSARLPLGPSGRARPPGSPPETWTRSAPDLSAAQDAHPASALASSST